MPTFVTIARENGELVDVNLDAVAYVLRDRKGAAQIQFANESVFLMLTPGEAKQLVPSVARPVAVEAPVVRPAVECATF